jgi:hypothetical protein
MVRGLADSYKSEEVLGTQTISNTPAIGIID